MMPYRELAQLCKPLEWRTTYYRPFVCRRYKHDNPFTIWIVGINPATAIETSDIGLDEYAQMLTDYDLFNEFYSEHRRRLEQEEWSATRRGIRRFGDKLPNHYNVIETNVNAFPTKSAEHLNDGSVDFSVVKKGWMVFKTILNTFRPNVIVAHGKDTSTYLTQLVQFTPDMSFEKLGIRERELTGIRYDDQHLSLVLSCTHFSRISHREFGELHSSIEFLYSHRPADRDFLYLKPMPKERETFEMNLFLTDSEYARLRYGFYPLDDTKWFIYTHESKINVHRSAFGYCIFELDMEYDGERHRIVSATVNRNREQFNSNNVDEDRNTVLDLLHHLFHIWIY